MLGLHCNAKGSGTARHNWPVAHPRCVADSIPTSRSPRSRSCSTYVVWNCSCAARAHTWWSHHQICSIARCGGGTTSFIAGGRYSRAKLGQFEFAIFFGSVGAGRSRNSVGKSCTQKMKSATVNETKMLIAVAPTASIARD